MAKAVGGYANFHSDTTAEAPKIGLHPVGPRTCAKGRTG